MKAREVMKKYDICRFTLCRWVKEGKMDFVKLPSGRYDYRDKIEKYQLNELKKNVIYARVSSTTQKDNLPRQIERLKDYVSKNGYIIDEVYSEVASALNYNRKKYRKLFDEVINRQIGNIFIEYKDRLLRIGFEDFEQLCQKFGTKVVVIDNTEDRGKTKQQEITEDLISIVHHFSSKIYSSRRIKKITDTIKDYKQI